MGAWWRVALITALVGLWFSLSYLKRYNYKWGFNYINSSLNFPGPKRPWQ